MAGTHFLPDANGSTERPDVISVLGVLTFINSGTFLFIYTMCLFGMIGLAQMPQDEFAALVHEAAGRYMEEDEMSRLDELVRIIHGSGAVLMLIYLVRTILRLVGAIGIWRGRKSGFYLYAAAQLGGLFAPHLVLPWSMLGVFGPLMAVAMTAVYGGQLKRLT